MNRHLIFVIFFVSSIDHFVNAIRYPYIGDCYYDKGSFYAESNLTLVCEKDIRETTLFKQYDKSVCHNRNECFDSDCREGFYKFMVGRITFKNCELAQIPNNIFKVYENVRIFNMSGLGTQTFLREHFSDAKLLKKLNASHNEIIEIPSNLFVNCAEISEVDLSWNKIAHFDAHAFAVGNHLKYLYIAHNNISTLSVETFQKLTELKQLSISHNQITELPSFLFHKNEQLTEVDLSSNKIRKIDDFAFAGDFKLKSVNLSSNQLTTFQKRFSDNHANLTHLDLSHNRISTLKADTFENLRDLQMLDLSGNMLNKLDSKTFENLKSLEVVNLSRNRLTEIQAGMFATLVNMHILDLSFNALKVLNAVALPTQANQLELMVIGNNQLHELIDFTSERIPNTKIIGIDSNLFNCTYLDVLFQSITWKHLDSILKRIECNSANETADLSENSTLVWTLETTTTSDISTIPDPEEKSEEFVMTNDDNENCIDLACLLEYQMQTDRELKSLKSYFYILVCVVTIGFTIAVLGFMRLHIEMHYMSKIILLYKQPQYDVKYTAQPPDGVENHAYETIEIRKSSEPVKTPI